jgi:hypothetical protein
MQPVTVGKWKKLNSDNDSFRGQEEDVGAKERATCYLNVDRKVLMLWTDIWNGIALCTTNHHVEVAEEVVNVEELIVE